MADYNPRADMQLQLNDAQSDYLYKLSAAAREMKVRYDVLDQHLTLNRNRLSTGEIPEIVDTSRYNNAVGEVRALIGAAGLVFGEYTEHVDDLVSAATRSTLDVGWIFEAHKRWEAAQ